MTAGALITRIEVWWLQFNDGNFQNMQQLRDDCRELLTLPDAPALLVYYISKWVDDWQLEAEALEWMRLNDTKGFEIATGIAVDIATLIPQLFDIDRKQNQMELTLEWVDMFNKPYNLL